MTENTTDLMTIAKSWLQREEQFPIDFDEIWERAGYARRDVATRAFEAAIRNFNLVDGIDYSALKRVNVITRYGVETNGKPIQTWHMTIGAAKRFLTAAQTDAGFKLIDSLIKAEEELTAIKAGGAATNRVANILDNPAQMQELMLELIVRRDQDQQTIKTQAEKIALDAPKIAAFAHIESSDGSMCPTQAAKSLGMRPCDLFDMLARLKWAYKRGTWIGHQDKINAGLVEHTLTTIARPDGSTKTVTQMKITARGIARLARELTVNLFN